MRPRPHANPSTEPANAPPAEVERLSDQRAEARQARDFETADRLKAQIEAAGWKVIDEGSGYRLEPAHAPNVELGETTLYGSSAGVPSRLDEPDVAPATLVLIRSAARPVLDDETDALGEAEAAALGEAAPATQVVIVDETSEPPDTEPLHPDAADVEVLFTAAPLDLAGAWNVGLRRALGAVVILLPPDERPAGDVVGPVLAALADPSVAVVGSVGLTSSDMRRWQSADPGTVDALGPGLIAFRRSEARLRGPLDERFRSARQLAIWWSLVLRDEGLDVRPRTAVALDLPLAGNALHEEEVDERAARRDFYRLIDRFGQRFDMLAEPVRPTAASAKARRRRR